MTYVPKRDHRFEYLWDAMSHIEERQCRNCVNISDRAEYPMCFEVEALFIEEQPIPIINDFGDLGLECQWFKEKE